MSGAVWNIEAVGGGGASGGSETRVPEDILHADNPDSPLVRRGPVMWHGNAYDGWAGSAQHHSSVPRPPTFINGRSGGLQFTGVGAEANGYGSKDSGGGVVLRLDRAREGISSTDLRGTVVTVSGRIVPMFEDTFSTTDGSVTYVQQSMNSLTFWLDTQAWDGTDRGYYRIQYQPKSGLWAIGMDNTEYPVQGESHTMKQIPGATAYPGGNQNKQTSVYFAYSCVLYDSNPVAIPWTPENQGQPGVGMGTYGHFQIGNQIFDLRGLGAGYCRHLPQAGDVGNAFNGGMNPIVSFGNPMAGVWGGVTIERWEVTVGDELVPAS